MEIFDIVTFLGVVAGVLAFKFYEKKEQDRRKEQSELRKLPTPA